MSNEKQLSPIERSRNVPQLRFSEFKGKLVPKTIGEVCIVKTGSKDTKDKDDDGEYPFFVRSNTVEKINSYSYDGEAILTSGDGVGVGKNFHYINGKFDYHQRVYALKEFDKNYNGQFIYQFFSEKFYKRVLGLSAKNSVDSVRMDFITKMKINFPQLPEQQKIASFLTDVDAKITQLTKKKSLLEQYKKGIMQKIFNQELRFKDDNGNEFPKWVVKKLGEVAEINKGKQLNAEFLSKEGSYPCISGGINPSGYTEDFNKIENTITISEGGNSCGYVNFFKTKFWCGGHSYAIENLKNNVVNDFLFQLLKQSEIKIMRLRVGSGLPNIQKKDINNFKFKLPVSISEQTKIANFLSDIDLKIEALNSKIENTQTFKKGLLQQMFV